MVSGAMHKLCHKLFQHALSRENDQHPRPAQNLLTDHHIRPAQRSTMTSFRIVISPLEQVHLLKRVPKSTPLWEVQ